MNQENLIVNCARQGLMQMKEDWISAKTVKQVNFKRTQGRVHARNATLAILRKLKEKKNVMNAMQVNTKMNEDNHHVTRAQKGQNVPKQK